MGLSRSNNESAPKLYIEFEDDDSAGVAGEAELVSDREAVGSGVAGWTPRWRPRWSWGAVPTRYRKVVAGTAALVGLAAAIGDSLAAQAAQHAADRSSLLVMDAEYSPDADGNGVDLLIDVADTGDRTVVVTGAQVRQPDLSLNYLGAPVDLVAHQQLEIGLWGQYDCSPPVPMGSGAGADVGAGGSGVGNAGAGGGAGQSARDASVRITVRNSQGNVNTVELSLPKAAQLPEPWRDGRTAYCTVAWGG